VLGDNCTEKLLIELDKGDETVFLAVLETMEKLEKKLFLTQNDLKFKLSCQQDFVRAKNDIDSFSRSWIQAFEKDSCFYDVGSNVGTFSLYAAKLHGENFRAYAFELHYASYATLCANIISNGLGSRVIPLSMALAKDTGIGTAFFRSLDSGSALHQLDETVDYKGDIFSPESQIRICKTTIDVLCSNLNFETPRYLKIDTDGNEFDVLKGAEITLEESQTMEVLVEFVHHSDALERHQKLNDFMESCGFKVKGHSQPRLISNLIVEDILFFKN